ncbi:MAG: AmmeMemoRadiSam system protein B [Planctomycetes bacterium]|nr:AmmeMemoRadiSam system protein B [Planctomycetota bacterium]
MHKRDCDYAFRGWYPSDEQQLRSMIEGFKSSTEKRKAIGGISPHAGYFFSGKCANMMYSAVDFPEHILILSVSHQNHYDHLALYPEGAWKTPLGELSIDTELNSALLALTSVKEDAEAHDDEHSGEIQLPFIKYYMPDAKISVINVGLSPLYHSGETSFEKIKEFGENIGSAIKNFGKDVFIVASSDMSHEQGKKKTLAQDKHALEVLPNYDVQALYNVLVDNRISMCGGIPALIMMDAAKQLNATNCEIIDYYTSADITSNDDGYTVGYCSALIS